MGLAWGLVGFGFLLTFAAGQLQKQVAVQKATDMPLTPAPHCRRHYREPLGRLAQRALNLFPPSTVVLICFVERVVAPSPAGKEFVLLGVLAI